MILVTIGTMFPFDRLVQAMDLWAASHPNEEVVAQLGTLGDYRPRHMRCDGFMSPIEFAEVVAASRLIVAHAGTGSYMLAAEKGRPVVLFPRRAALKEHTSDHQLETVRWLRSKEGVFVALDVEDLPDAIEAALANPLAAVEPISKHAPPAFVSRLRNTLADLISDQRRA